jgi:hypothetical protein
MQCLFDDCHLKWQNREGCNHAKLIAESILILIGSLLLLLLLLMLLLLIFYCPNYLICQKTKNGVLMKELLTT